MKKYKVFIVEDHPIVIKGLSQVINKQEFLEVCGYSTNAPDALKKIEQIKPDLITVDINLKDSNGLELIKDIKYSNDDVKILVISMFDENVYAERCIKSGANGYIMKEKLTKELIKAIQAVLNGKTYLSEDISVNLINQMVKGGVKDSDDPIVSLLSDRELEVFDLIGDGLTTGEIAEKTNLGVKTVETYKNKIKEKLELKNFTQLIKKAVEWKLTK